MQPVAALSLDADQTRCGEDVQVLRDGLTRRAKPVPHDQAAADLEQRLTIPLHELVEDRSAGRIREGEIDLVSHAVDDMQVQTCMSRGRSGEFPCLGEAVDLADEPVNRLPDADRRAAIERGVAPLAALLGQARPDSVVAVKRDIEHAVTAAIELSGLDLPLTVLPFPVRQWRPVYEQGLAELLRNQRVGGFADA